MQYLLVTLLICPILISAQPKKTNTIEVENVAFDSAVVHLLDMGFSIDKKDEKYGTIQTEFKEVTPIVMMSMSVRIKDSNAVITGRWWSKMFTNAQFGPGTMEIYTVEKGTAPVRKLTFNLMDQYAKSLGKVISYFTR